MGRRRLNPVVLRGDVFVGPITVHGERPKQRPLNLVTPNQHVINNALHRPDNLVIVLVPHFFDTRRNHRAYDVCVFVPIKTDGYTITDTIVIKKK